MPRAKLISNVKLSRPDISIPHKVWKIVVTRCFSPVDMHPVVLRSPASLLVGEASERQLDLLLAAGLH